jgi:phage terminase large subunit-like protein
MRSPTASCGTLWLWRKVPGLEPLMIGITTAGVRYDSSGGPSICYQFYEHGKRVATGEVDDPSFYMAWWEAR